MTVNKPDMVHDWLNHCSDNNMIYQSNKVNQEQISNSFDIICWKLSHLTHIFVFLDIFKIDGDHSLVKSSELTDIDCMKILETNH